MKTISLFILLGLLFTSCLDDFEPRTSSFTKVYGTNLEPRFDGLLATDNGFLLYGSFDKSTQGDPGNSGDVPTIIKTDELGNEMWSTSIGLSKVSFKNNLNFNILYKDTTWEISRVWINNVIQLNNGNFFVAMSIIIENELRYNAPGYIVLSSEGEVLEHNTLMDNVIDPSYPSDWGLVDINDFMIRFQPYAFNIPGSSDIIIMFRFSSNSIFTNRPHYFSSLYRLREGDYQNPVWIKDYSDQFPEMNFTQVNHLTFDDGKIVLVGTGIPGGEPCFRIILSKIDSQSGELIQDQFLSPDTEHHEGIAVIPFGDGYAVQNYHTNFEITGCDYWDSNDPNAVSQDIGGVRFVKENFESSTLVDITLPELGDWAWFSFLETFDGGLVSGFATAPGTDGLLGTYIVKVDAEGVFLWEYRDPSSLFTYGLFETVDGGIVFGTTSRFGSTNKWTLNKLTKDGVL